MKTRSSISSIVSMSTLSMLFVQSTVGAPEQVSDCLECAIKQIKKYHYTNSHEFKTCSMKINVSICDKPITWSENIQDL